MQHTKLCCSTQTNTHINNSNIDIKAEWNIVALGRTRLAEHPMCIYTTATVRQSATAPPPKYIDRRSLSIRCICVMPHVNNIRVWTLSQIYIRLVVCVLVFVHLSTSRFRLNGSTDMRKRHRLEFHT